MFVYACVCLGGLRERAGWWSVSGVDVGWWRDYKGARVSGCLCMLWRCMWAGMSSVVIKWELQSEQSGRVRGFGVDAHPNDIRTRLAQLFALYPVSSIA